MVVTIHLVTWNSDDIESARFLSDEVKNEQVICLYSPKVGTGLQVFKSKVGVNDKGGNDVALPASCRKVSGETHYF